MFALWDPLSERSLILFWRESFLTSFDICCISFIKKSGASGGNRTRIYCMASSHSTIKLYLHNVAPRSGLFDMAGTSGSLNQPSFIILRPLSQIMNLIKKVSSFRAIFDSTLKNLSFIAFWWIYKPAASWPHTIVRLIARIVRTNS